MQTYRASPARRVLLHLHERLAHSEQELGRMELSYDERTLRGATASLQFTDIRRISVRLASLDPVPMVLVLTAIILVLSSDPTDPSAWSVASLVALSTFIHGYPVTTLTVHTTDGRRLIFRVWGRCADLELFALDSDLQRTIAHVRSYGSLGTPYHDGLA